MSKQCDQCDARSDYPHDSTCWICSGPHAHPGTGKCHSPECAERAEALEHETTRKALRELVVAVDDLLKSIKAEADEPQGIVSHAIATRHDLVRRLITSDIYCSRIGLTL